VNATSFTLFETAIGEIGLAWTDKGVCALQLPEESAGQTRTRLLSLLKDATELDPPPVILDAIDRLTRQMAGEEVDLAPIPVDFSSATPFFRRVFELARAIPPGETTTYGKLARAAGSPGAARAVGMAMARNPVALIVPCHRVIASDGKLTGFSAPGGLATKVKLLALERRTAADRAGQPRKRTLGSQTRFDI
jgi:methylated-DNA-[protein]-cysteine S-methyltransferase